MSKSTPKGFKTGFKSFAKGLGEVLEASAAASELRRQVESDAREMVETALSEYQNLTGKPYVARSNPASNLPWDPDFKGHLINCRENCRISHCLTCGQENFGFVYCSSHRP